MSDSAAKLRWYENPLVIVAWSIGVTVGYAMFPSSDTAAVTAEAIWAVGLIIWMLAGSWASSRFYNGSGKGVAGQRVSQTGNFPEGRG